MPAIDDGRSVRLFGQGEDVAGSKEVIIGTRRADAALASGDKLASFCSDADGPSPSEKAYVDYLGAITATGATLAASTITTMTPLIGTAPSGTGITVNASGAPRYAMQKVTITFAAVQAAATTQDITLWTLPAKTRVLRVIADVTQAWTGGAISDCDVTVGNSAGGNQYLLSFDVDTATGTYGDAVAEIGAGVLSATYADISWASPTVVQCRFTSVGANLAALTAGSMTVYIEVCVYP